MSSSVFYRFRNVKDPTRIEFDGTGISVFELKRDIIIKSGLGDGTDFDLAIVSDDGSNEGKLHQCIDFIALILTLPQNMTMIPRSSLVLQRLSPYENHAQRKAPGERNDT